MKKKVDRKKTDPDFEKKHQETEIQQATKKPEFLVRKTLWREIENEFGMKSRKEKKT